MQGLTQRLSPVGFCVDCVLPGFMRTQRQVQKWLTLEFEPTVRARQCLKRFIDPADVATIVVMLAAATARSVTNQTLVEGAGWF